MFVRVKLEELKRWRDVLDNFDNRDISAVAEEIHDIIDDNEKKIQAEAKRQETISNSLPYVEEIIPRSQLKVGEEYFLSSQANFKQSYADLHGSRVKLTDVRRTKCTVTSLETRFKGSNFTVNMDVLRRIK